MLILVAHGSRDPGWRGSLHALAEAVESKLNKGRVEIAFMQFDGPTLPEVVEKAITAGEKRLALFPMFMASAGHVDKDIRPLVAELAQAHPEVHFELMTPVGENSLLPGLLATIFSGSSESTQTSDKP
jgi:sirohydrochlorin cobaltochelatase